MIIQDKHPGDANVLRARAEDVISKSAVRPPEYMTHLSPAETQRMLHELRVHQIELEMQNEELRRAQSELEIARAHYFDLYDLAPVGYCTLNETGIVLEANLALAALLDIGRGALLKQPITRFIFKDDQDLFYMHRKMLEETGQAPSFELRMTRSDGTIVWTHLVTSATEDDGGAPVYRVAISDVTTRRRTEEALEKAYLETEVERLHLESVMAVLPTGLAITDAAGALVKFNTEFERIWGGPMDSISDYKGWWDGTRTPLEYRDWASSVATREGRLVKGQMLEIERRDGSHAFVINSAAPVFDSHQNVIGSVVAINDITELRTANHKIKELNKKLQSQVAAVEAINKELESFSHSVSHDLRTPLLFVNTIAGKMLHECETPLSDIASQQAQMIMQVTEEMAAMTENLLILSQVNRRPVSTHVVDLGRLFRKTAGEFRRVQESRDIEIEVQDLAPCRGNESLLKEVAVNLLGNAIKFTRQRERARILIGCVEKNGEFVYFVKDNGVGFDANDSHSLFFAFRRLHKEQDFEGSGIGLSLVKRIIERHGGRIWAEGKVGEGATFYFTLPEKKEL